MLVVQFDAVVLLLTEKTTGTEFNALFLIVKEQRTDSRRSGTSRGAKRDRTANLLVANQALSQLSYSPATHAVWLQIPCIFRNTVGAAPV